MLAAGVVDLFVRMLWSLGLVLAIIAIAYVVMRHRNGVSTRPSRRAGPRAAARAVVGAAPSRAAKPARQARSSRQARRPGRAHAIEVVGRVGLSRSTSAVALKFGDKVLLVGASEQAQPTVLAEIDAATWELCQVEAEWTVPAEIGAGATDAVPAERPSFLDALREATVRRA